MTPAPPSLFELNVPPGFRYHRAFLSDTEEAALAAAIATIKFSTFEMRGVVARRRVAFFGESYAGAEAAPVPPFLLGLRASLAAWANLEPAALAMALINEYRPGTPIGWHRDAPQYELVAGVSLLSSCRMKLRPYRASTSLASRSGPRRATHQIMLERRSAYLLTGESRNDYEHHIPAVEAFRYSVTFRTLRQQLPRADHL